MCGSCRVTVDGKMKFACVEGPDFDGHQVDFKELAFRQSRFKAQEVEAHEGLRQGLLRTTSSSSSSRRGTTRSSRSSRPTRRRCRSATTSSAPRNFLEVNLGYRMVDALQEAERCIQCVRPTCIEGCPVHDRHSPLHPPHPRARPPRRPRVDPGEQPLRLDLRPRLPAGEPVRGAVHPREGQDGVRSRSGASSASSATTRRPSSWSSRRTRARSARSRSWARARRASPARATSRKAGADVTIYEALHVIGGVLKYGIPSFRLPRTTIDREVKNLEALGVKFETNKVIGKTFTIPQLQTEMGYDAVFVGTGAGAPSFLGIPGEFAGAVYSANEFLTRVNLMGGDQLPVRGHARDARPPRRRPRRRQHRDGLPARLAPPRSRRGQVRLPAHGGRGPRAHRGDPPRQGGGDHLPLAQEPAEDRDGRGGRREGRSSCQVMELGPPDKSGRRRPVPVEGETETFLCDTVIYALGTKANPVIARSTPGLDTRERGLHQRRPEDAGREPAGRLRGRRHRDGRRDRHPRARRGPPRGQGDREVPRDEGVAGRPRRGDRRRRRRRKHRPPRIRREGLPEVPPAPRGRRGIRLLRGHSRSRGRATAARRSTRASRSRTASAPPAAARSRTGTTSRSTPRRPSRPSATRSRSSSAASRSTRAAPRRRRTPALKELFTHLSDMERGHMETLSRRYHVPEPDTAAPGLSAARVAVYADADRRTETGEDLLKLAVHLERRARNFFLERGPGPRARLGRVEALPRDGGRGARAHGPAHDGARAVHGGQAGPRLRDVRGRGAHRARRGSSAPALLRSFHAPFGTSPRSCVVPSGHFTVTCADAAAPRPKWSGSQEPLAYDGVT